MPAATTSPQAFEEAAASGRLGPVYLLEGPDDELKARLVARLVETVEEDLRPFNVDKIFPADLREDARKQFWNALQLARTLPMMAPRRIVIVAQAEKLMPIFRQDDEDGGAPAQAPGARKGRKAPVQAAGDAEIDALRGYLEDPAQECVLVFVAGPGLKGSLKAVKLLRQHALVVECDAMQEQGGAAAWVREEAAANGVRIDRAAAQLLASLAGNDIGRLRAEFERALLFASGEGVITEAAVREIAGARTTQDPWAMTNALQRGEAGAALRELALKLEAGEYPVMILGQLGWYVRTRMPDARARAGVEALLRTDLALKTSGGDPRVLLERLVVELCG